MRDRSQRRVEERGVMAQICRGMTTSIQSVTQNEMKSKEKRTGGETGSSTW
jgi:hypothetical protein